MNELLLFLRETAPTQTQIEWGGVFAACGSVMSFICGWDDAVAALVAAMAVDYISGVIAAYLNPCLALNSQKGFRGICKKILILLLVSLAHLIDIATSLHIVHLVAVWFFLGNEGLSIIENAAKCGVPVPAKLRDTLEQLSAEKDVRRKAQ